MYDHPNDLLRELLTCDDLDGVVTKILDAVKFRPFVIEKECRATRWGIGNALGDSSFHTYETEEAAAIAADEATKRWHSRASTKETWKRNNEQ